MVKGKTTESLGREICGPSYDRHLMNLICEINDGIATTKRIRDPDVRRSDRNYEDLIRQR